MAWAMAMRSTALAAFTLSFISIGCAGSDEPPGDDLEDLPVGDLSALDQKADGNWGSALTCKTAPTLPVLPHAEITISLDAQTLHLRDRSTGFDQVFPIGVGVIETDPTSSVFGESRSYYPLASGDRSDFVIKPSVVTACKVWWTDPESGDKLPVFAGLPFLSWSGPYGIHGPIDNFRATNGGSLRRGYVSHGCIRMEAADILAVYARIKGVAQVPVHVQRAPERTADGSRIEIPARWIGSECRVDGDCNFAGGLCHRNPWSGRGYCTAGCTSTCADRAGAPTTMCVADPDAPGHGECVARQTAVNSNCRPLDHFVPRTMARFNRPSVVASVCMPGSPGWIGDRCLADSDCGNGTECRGGLCTQACDRYCADQPGYADTFCAVEPALGVGGQCARTCTPTTNGSECAGNSTCVARGRIGAPGTVRNVCVPTAP
jgi:L,D-transpeptidase catalytic domain